MDLVVVLLLVAVILFAIAAWMTKSLVALGLAFFAGSFLAQKL